MSEETQMLFAIYEESYLAYGTSRTEDRRRAFDLAKAEALEAYRSDVMREIITADTPGV